MFYNIQNTFGVNILMYIFVLLFNEKRNEMKEQKTAQMLKYGDTLYEATIEKIKEVKFDLLKQSYKGVSVKFNERSGESNWCTVHPFSTTISHEDYRGRVWYINKNKAIEAQMQLRKNRLNSLKNDLLNSTLALDLFIGKYFGSK